MYDVAIIGGGLAGLNAALKCKRAGKNVVLFEASGQIGGKLQTDWDDEGFQFDRGFQVDFTAYDEVPNEAVELLSDMWEVFSPGARIVGYGEVNKAKPIRSLLCKAVTPGDLVKLLRLNQISKSWQTQQTHQSTHAFLKEFGFSSKCIGCFFTPFLGGIFLDRSLEVSSKQFLKIWFYLSSGRTITYSEGISWLPFALESELLAENPQGIEPVHILEDARISKIEASSDALALYEDECQHFARTVIIATDPLSAGHLTGSDYRAEFKSSTCLYFASDRPVIKRKSIVLNPARDALVNQLVPLSNVNPRCAPRGKHLCSATIIGDRPESDEELARMAIEEMSGWGLNLPELEFKRAYRIKEAQLLQEPGFEDRLPAIKTHLPGVFLAGEMTTSSSINDALKSGRLAAEAALAYLGGQ